MYWYLQIPPYSRPVATCDPKTPPATAASEVFKPPALLHPGSASNEYPPRPKAALAGAPPGYTKVGGLPIVDQPPLSLCA